MNELALFAGAGGGILGGKLLGWRCVCAVEWDAYAASVLVARQNDGCLEPFPIWDDIRSFDGGAWRGRVDVVSGGFPCQDISCAGKGAGIDGERSGMWVEMARVIGEVGPRFVLVENSPMLTVRGLGRVLGDLVALGYDAVWGVLGADDAGAPHRRKRIWVLGWRRDMADADSAGCEWADAPQSTRWIEAGKPAGTGDDVGNALCADGEWGAGGVSGAEAAVCGPWAFHGREFDGPEYAGEGGREGDVADAANNGPGRREQQPKRSEGERDVACFSDTECNGRGEVEPSDASGARGKRPAGEINAPTGSWWSAEPDVGRVADGVAARVDRLRCLGNGQVPAVVRLAWETLGGLRGGDFNDRSDRSDDFRTR